MAHTGPYSCSAIANLLDQATAFGYTYCPIREGTLGYGKFVLIAPEHPNPEKIYMNIVVEEYYVNEWTSAHHVRKCRKLSKQLLKEIQKASDEHGRE